MVNKQLLEELQKERAFVGQNQESAKALENKIKSRYEISDWNTEAGTGWLVYDRSSETETYFSPNSRLTLETRYLEKGEDRRVVENGLDLFARVAVNIADADLKYDPEKDISETAERFLEAMIYKQFMPNTPTLCNAGRPLQQLSACFVLPVEDYMATDDIFEDPEKQGDGIYDALRYMSMIHKSGGGTGFNFSHLRPRADRISTTFGSSSGPVSFIKVFDASTNAVNQGGFRRGANMGILNYTHPDIFEFVSEKARNKGSLENFNLSAGLDEEFMKSVKDDGFFRLISPKGERAGVKLEERVWKTKNVLKRGTQNYKELYSELDPSLIIGENGKTVICTYNEREVGKVDDDGSILISSRALFDYICECAWDEGCPGIVYTDRLQKANFVPEIGDIEATNPCGEQPLLPYGACNLGGINLSTCVSEGNIDYEELDRRIELGVHFLDNVVDKSKFPFQKIYGVVRGTRNIGLGIMGWAEMLSQLGISYDNPEALKVAKHLSTYITEKARESSSGLAEKRGVFPFWEGSIHEKEGRRLRNAAITTIAPNGTTGMICDANGGIEPFFKVAYVKTCMDGKKLFYRAKGLEERLEEIIPENKLEEVWAMINKTGSIQGIEGIPDELKAIYKTAHDISPENHVKMQAAFQVGEKNIGVDNAVSKTVNLPEKATVQDIKNIFLLSYKEGAVGTTIFRDKSKVGVYGGLEETVELVQNSVKAPPILDIKPHAIKYRIKRPNNDDSLHITVTGDIYADDKNKKAYFLPGEVFQERAPLGHATSVTFAQSGIDRTEIFRGPDPNYAEIVGRLLSVSSNEEEGLGPSRIKSIEHAVGVAFEHDLTRNGVIGRDENGKLINLVRKPKLRKVEPDTKEFEDLISQVRFGLSNKTLEMMGNGGKLDKKFICKMPGCECEEYVYEAGCNKPKCKKCGWVLGGGCG